MIYAFTLDASACSGCKACQEACKDKNNLPIGIAWRRVVEVSGGEWRPAGAAWENSIFAYNLSLACNHCTHPKCAGVCPTDAYTVRPDGIVLLDPSKCMGCGYCSWACPYGAPQYDPALGIVTKCDFCYDNLDAGLPPTCVSACPLRVLEYSSIEDLSSSQKLKNLWQLPGSEHPYPLPKFSRTEPHLAIKFHPEMSNPLDKRVGNREEILLPGSIENRQKLAAGHELPLIVFTLLMQMAAGMAVSGLVFRTIPGLALLTIGVLLGVGGFVSFFHLGRKRNAWRSVTHLRKSWLSREVLMAGLFSIAWAATIGWERLGNGSTSYLPVALLGLGLVYSMSRVYLLRAVPAWNTWRTPVAFFLSSAVLGIVGLRSFTSLPGWYWITGLAMAVELGVMLTEPALLKLPVSRLRMMLLGSGMLITIVAPISPQVNDYRFFLILFTLALLEEIIGRWQFYARREPFPFRTD